MVLSETDVIVLLVAEQIVRATNARENLDNYL